MGKSNYFSTKSVFGQLISLIDERIITSSVKKHDADRYTKRFKTKDHLISMLFCTFAKCNSLREVSCRAKRSISSYSIFPKEAPYTKPLTRQSKKYYLCAMRTLQLQPHLSTSELSVDSNFVVTKCNHLICCNLVPVRYTH